MKANTAMGLVLIGIVYLLACVYHFTSPTQAWIGWWELTYFAAFTSLGISLFTKRLGASVFSLLALALIIVNEITALYVGQSAVSWVATVAVILLLLTLADGFTPQDVPEQSMLSALSFIIIFLWSTLFFSIRLYYNAPLPSWTIAYHGFTAALGIIGAIESLMGKYKYGFAVAILAIISMLWQLSMGWGLQVIPSIP